MSLLVVNQVLDELGKLFGIDIRLDSNGKSHVVLENRYDTTLQLTESGNYLKLLAYVGDHINDGSSEILEYLLNCNYESDFLQSCTIGLCSKSNKFTLSYLLSAVNPDVTLVQNSLLNFGTVIQTLDYKLAEKLLVGQSSPSSKLNIHTNSSNHRFLIP